jgi:tetratricopeptide (TPR) repeat protein
VALVACGACGGQGQREREADRLYLRGRYENARGIYATLAAARDEPRLWAKTAAAAMRAGQLDSAAGAWVALASADSSRRGEAADGLAEVAREAMRGQRMSALDAAVTGLTRIAPTWPLTSYAYALVRSGALGPAGRIRLLPRALAGAPDAAQFDSLLFEYGGLMADRSCAEAAYAFRAVVRRTHDGPMRDSASSGFATCALRLGITALDSSDVIEADRWFGRAARVDSEGWTGRRALLGLGDARLRQGDPIAAAIAWQRAVGTAPAGDSLAMLARARLAALAAEPATRDTTGTDR